ncbi:hypothetical protein AVEN_44509-1 [Araneus ventricosus]|uniref:Uncharacterized protein n=1 Tax=Araneus ventricosus TaxID=182803 RepID=A0A4Y2NWB0_ARAVE|nr:hypothetical protein AVEN_44509-1 [Araneus ventricosus]
MKVRHRCTPLENVEDYERLILLVPHRDGLVDVRTRRESVTITFYLALLPRDGATIDFNSLSYQEMALQGLFAIRRRRMDRVS